MVTIEYLLWLKHVAEKQSFTVADWGTYSFIAALSLATETKTLKLQAEELGTILSMSNRTVSRSLTKLASNGLIKWERTGQITVLAPAPQWLEKIGCSSRRPDKCSDKLKNSASIPRAQETAPAGNPTQPPNGGRVTPAVEALLDELDSKTLSSDILGKSLDELKKQFNVQWQNQ